MTAWSKVPPRLAAYGAAGLGLILDQGTKWMTEQWLYPPGASVPVVEPLDLLRLTYVTNTGGAWGLMAGFRPLFVAVGAAVSAGCVWFIETHPGRRMRLAVALLLGGSLGNTLDRLFRPSGVVDFVDLGIYGTRWPTFNVADTILVAGIGLILWELYRGEVLFPPEASPSEPDAGRSGRGDEPS